MKDIPEVHENPERETAKSSERKIETFDDLKTTDKSGQIETFDDIADRRPSDRSIRTFDDIAESKEGTVHYHGEEGIEKGPSGDNAPEAIEQKRLSHAAKEIKNAGWLKPEEWETLTDEEKRIALDREAGRALGEAYDQPTPPLSTEKTGSNELEKFGDGFSYDSSEDKIIGSDYGIRMNEKGMSERDRKLFGDDPREALETYAHEFRHSYQAEQARAFDKGLKTDDQERAREWSENMKDYKEPPDAALAKTDPERYFQEYETYRNQPVEKDAREFASNLTDKVYATDEDIERSNK